MSEQIHIVIVEENQSKTKTILDGLKAAGDFRITIVENPLGLSRKLAELKADIVLIGFDNPSRDTLEEMTTATSPAERPVAMFVDQFDSAMMKSAIDAGVSAYVVDGLHPDRIKPIMEAAIARFHSFARLRAELSATKTALAERKTLDRAKGLLMKARGISEEEAYELIRKAAMDQGKRIVEVADGLVTAAAMLS